MPNLPDDLPRLLRKHGLKVVEIEGWRHRGRPASTGGFDPDGVLCHHTGAYDKIADAADDLSYANWLAKVGRSDLPAPLCQLALSREGVVYICAAGRANHAGIAKASGTMAAGDGNRMYIGIEAMNDGSQGWDKSQYNAYVKLCAALCVEVTHNSRRTVRGHKETSLTGKWDPGRLNMGVFRTRVATRIAAMKAPAPAPAPSPVVNNVTKARYRLRQALNLLKEVAASRKVVHQERAKIQASLDRMPKS